MDTNNSISLVKNKLGQKWPFLIFRISLYVILAVILLQISWYAWPDLIIDFGEELYVTWRLTEGDMLYRDITNYYYGPLSYYWNALWFYMFGVSINTLIAVNLSLLVLLVYLLEDWLRVLSDRFTATVAVLFFISVFAFGRYVGAGNYNYVTPYLHSATHGLILILAMLAFMNRWTKSNRPVWLWLSGIMLGLAVMTKIEIFAAASATAIVYLAAIFFIEPQRRNSIPASLIGFIIATLMPPLSAILIFSYFVSPNMAISYTFNALRIVGDERFSKINGLLFYKKSIGTNDIFGNLVKMGQWTWTYLNVVLVGSFLALILRNAKRWRLLITALITGGIVAYFYFMPSQDMLTGIARPLPLIMTAGFFITAWLLIKQNKDQNNHVLPLCLASFAFSIIFLLKMALNARLYHFGFTLAMPAMVLLIVILIGWLPKYLNRYGAGWAFRSLVLGFLITISASYIKLSNDMYSRNDYVCCLENKIEIIRTNQVQGPVLDATLRELEKRLKPGQNFTVLPRGVMLNYLLRRPDPSGHLYLLFDILTESDEQPIINEFTSNPPDFIVFNHVDVHEFGFNYFGKDLGADLYNWINKNYKTVWKSGDLPFQPETRFGVIIAERMKSGGK